MFSLVWVLSTVLTNRQIFDINWSVLSNFVLFKCFIKSNQSFIKYIGVVLLFYGPYFLVQYKVYFESHIYAFIVVYYVKNALISFLFEMTAFLNCVHCVYFLIDQCPLILPVMFNIHYKLLIFKCSCHFLH